LLRKHCIVGEQRSRSELGKFASGKRWWHGNAVTDEVSVTNKKIHYPVRVFLLQGASGSLQGAKSKKMVIERNLC